MPRFIYISKTDEENSDYNATFDALRERFGNKIAPIVVPIWDDNKKVTGIIDVLNKRAYEMQNGKRVEIELPEGKEDVVTQFNDALKESVAETSEEFMDKFFSGEDFTYVEMIQGLRQGVRELSLFPRAVRLRRVHHGLPDADGQYRGASAQPGGGQHAQGHAPQRRQGGIRSLPGGVPSAFVFKTVSDQYGKYSFIKVISGTITSDLALVNARTGSPRRSWAGCTPCGARRPWRSRSSPAAISAPSASWRRSRPAIPCVTPARSSSCPPSPSPSPATPWPSCPRPGGQEDKIAQGLARLNEEDPTFTLVNNGETHQMVLSGTGDMQMDVLVSKLKSRFNVEAELKAPGWPIVRRSARQSPNRAATKSRPAVPASSAMSGSALSPIRRATRWSLPRRFSAAPCPRTISPAVEKGLREACVHGPLAGYPVVNLKAVLYDGSYHPVDSSEIAFKTAAQLAYKAAMPEANPVLMEPIGELKVTIPDSYMGDVIGDLNKRRGRIMGMNPTKDGEQVVEAEVPMAEMSTYAIDLRAMTQSRGSFTFHFVRYEDCPPAAQQKAIEEAKALAEE